MSTKVYPAISILFMILGMAAVSMVQSIDPKQNIRKNTMKKICFLLLILALAGGTLWAQDEKYEAMKGSETPAFQSFSDAGNCFVFGKYVVRTARNEDEGENISVYIRNTASSAEGACRTKGSPHLEIKDSDNNSFYGLFGNYLFVDSGTSSDSRGLDIYNLISRRSIYSDGYIGDAKLTEARFILFDTPSDKKGSLGTCKEAAKWKREGGGVGWMQGRKLDLQTLKVISVGTLRCYYME